MTAADRDSVETALVESGLPWARRDDAWAVTAPGGGTRVLLVTPTVEGVRVAAVLVEWDEADSESLDALRRFLALAAESPRGVGFVVEGTRASLTADVLTTNVEAGLPEALSAVVAACRTLAREARALLEPELARTYLEFHTRTTV
jgi:hypothetical protein